MPRKKSAQKFFGYAIRTILQFKLREYFNMAETLNCKLVTWGEFEGN